MPAASRQRRSAGWLAERIIELLDRSARPLGAAAIAEQLRAQEGTVHDSAVFRDLQRLTGDGRIDKVHLLSAYRLHRPGTLSLICPNCGAYAEADCSATRDELASLGTAQGYQPRTVVLEASARCRACLAPG